MKSLTFRNLDAIVVGDRTAPEPAAALCNGVLTITPGEVRFEAYLERTWTGPIPASDARPVVQHESTIELTAHHIEWILLVIPASFPSRLVVVDDSVAATERVALVQLTNWWHRRRVSRALGGCGFRVEVTPFRNPDEGSTITLE